MTVSQRPIFLASTSPRRHELVQLLGVPFQVIDPAGVDESSQSGSGFLRSQALARQKAEWAVANCAREVGDAPVVGADTVVSIVTGASEEVVGKPRDRDDAEAILRRLSGRTHRVITAVAVARSGAPTRVEVEVTLVTFRSLDEEEIADYVDSGDAAGKAGAYGIQSAGGKLIQSIRGCYYNVVGLPVRLLARMLAVEPPRCGCGAHELQRGAEGCSANLQPSE